MSLAEEKVQRIENPLHTFNARALLRLKLSEGGEGPDGCERAIALTGLEQHEHARSVLQCTASSSAECACEGERAGAAALTIIEELSEHFTAGELHAIYRHAEELLAGSGQPETGRRLLSCAGKVLCLYAEQVASGDDGRDIGGFGAPAAWGGFSFKAEVHRYEKFLISRALEAAEGVAARASQLLGFKHHYSLISLINRRHRSLLKSRSAVVPRKRSITRDIKAAARYAADKTTRQVAILHVEDSSIVAWAVKDTLESAGWSVETCADGTTALKRMASETHYDLLLLDNELPGIKGVELVRTARKLSHRRRTPIIMLSADDCETQAWGAGVDAFLHKPQDVLGLVETVSRLLNDG